MSNPMHIYYVKSNKYDSNFVKSKQLLEPMEIDNSQITNLPPIINIATPIPSAPYYQEVPGEEYVEYDNKTNELYNIQAQVECLNNNNNNLIKYNNTIIKFNNDINDGSYISMLEQKHDIESPSPLDNINVETTKYKLPSSHGINEPYDFAKYDDFVEYKSIYD
jgi:hypothetical protein